VSRVIATAALARDDSCGAHFREDSRPRDPSSPPAYTIVRQRDDRLEIAHERVRFTRVTPPTRI
jgi:fumarate reductase flavoprotein subunit